VFDAEAKRRELLAMYGEAGMECVLRGTLGLVWSLQARGPVSAAYRASAHNRQALHARPLRGKYIRSGHRRRRP